MTTKPRRPLPGRPLTAAEIGRRLRAEANSRRAEQALRDYLMAKAYEEYANMVGVIYDDVLH